MAITMSDKLQFREDLYEIKSCELNGRSVTYRAFLGISYCEKPADAIQTMNLFVPQAYYEGKSIHGYTLHTAPILIPNTVGGYMPGPPDEPGLDFMGRVNVIWQGLEHGYVLVSPGIRGRSSGGASDELFVGGKPRGEETETGKFTGKAPALIVDMKAVVRYLRHNRERIPGDTKRIITSGTSAGGALSALAGATGNSPDYASYLEEIGAADERDDIFAANCYCPIHNLEHADAAYEWQFCGINEFQRTKFSTENGKPVRKQEKGVMTPEQTALSPLLKALFPSYVNSLSLRDERGTALTLNEDGEGPFKEAVKAWVIASAQKELDSHDSAVRLKETEVHDTATCLKETEVSGSPVEEQPYLTIENGRVTELDWDGYLSFIGRMKTAPAFDALDLNSPENEEFGTVAVKARHFTDFAMEHDRAGGELAEADVIKMLNPTAYIGRADTAKHWRIRHGAADRDTSLAVPVILAALLQNNGYEVDFHLPWGLPHSGDYDLQELFTWIDTICTRKTASSPSEPEGPIHIAQ